MGYSTYVDPTFKWMSSADLYNLIESVEGSTYAQMAMNEIASNPQAEAVLIDRYIRETELKIAEYTLKNGSSVGANMVVEATTEATTALSSTSRISGEIATAVDLGTYTYEGTEYVAMKGVGKTATGTATKAASSAGSFVFGEVLPFLGAVATGAQIGLAINDAVYSARPDWWWYNVENWDNILLGHDTMLPILHDTATGTTYITEDAANAFMAAFNNMGVFNTGQPIEYDDTTGEVNGVTLNLTHPVYMGSTSIMARGRYNGHNYLYQVTTGAMFSTASGSRNGTIHFYSSEPFNVNIYCIDTDSGEVLYENTTRAESGVYSTYNGVRYWRYSYSIGSDYLSDTYRTSSNMPQSMSGSLNGDTTNYYLYGEGIVYPSTPTTIDGIEITGVTPSDTSSIANSYPALWNNKITTRGRGTDGNGKTINWVPVPMPDTTGMNEAIQSIIDSVKDGTKSVFDEDAQTDVDSSGLPQSDDGSYEDDDAEEKAKIAVIPQAIINTLNSIKEKLAEKTNPTGVPDSPATTPNPTTNPPIGDGETDPVTIPAGNISNGMVMVYNPTRGELVSFSRYLWDIWADLVAKLFVSPMDAIIGIHEIYVTPSVGGRANIVCGYLDSGVETNYVDERYVKIDCGTVKIEEKFGTILDYDYTTVSLFLPFIGYVNLSVDNVMRSSVKVVYTVDVLTGACNAQVIVTRDGNAVHTYSFGGSCAVSVPYSAGSMANIISNIAGAALSIAATAVGTGANIARMGRAAVVGVGGALLNSHADMSKSGGFGSNAGSMDDKKPFIIIERNLDATPTQFYKWQGYPLHQTATLSTCSGYTKATNIHFSGHATNDEVAEIESLLESGVIM